MQFRIYHEFTHKKPEQRFKTSSQGNTERSEMIVSCTSTAEARSGVQAQSYRSKRVYKERLPSHTPPDLLHDWKMTGNVGMTVYEKDGECNMLCIATVVLTLRTKPAIIRPTS